MAAAAAPTKWPGSVVLIIAAVIAVAIIAWQSRRVLAQAERAASTAAHAPLQLFRDPKADGSTVGTEAWFSNQITGLKNWLGIDRPEKTLTTYDQTKPFDAINDPNGSDVPVLVYGATPYMRE